jgi:hypothetical protein
VEWDVEYDGFEAEFEINGKDASANYNKEGHKLATEIEIKKSELPTLALTYLTTNYPNEKVKETAKIIDDKNIVTYEAELKIGGKNSDLIFDDSGNFIKVIKG